MLWGLSLHEKPTRRTTLVFVVLSCLGMLVIFRAAVWGGAILAPLDIGPALFSKYKWMDPTIGNVPRNHYVIDIFDYDLPRTYVAHRALAQGEFPWWDPYSAGGGPLAAESHFSITDPLRLAMFRAFPFLAAYNWTRILHSFLAGFCMFYLLRALGFAQFPTVFGALSFQFCTSQSNFYYTIPPHALFYYPLLWLALHKYARTRPILAIAAGALLCAGLLMAGTQQSHVYLVFFLACFAFGYGSCFRADALKILAATGGTFVLGCAMAAPILIPQIELFMLSTRNLSTGGWGAHLLTGLFSVTGVFPWFTGTFRTLDISKMMGQTGPAYFVYIGTPAMILAIVALLAGRKSPRAGRPEARTALLLVLVYLIVICSTPLVKPLYIRSSILALFGLIILSAVGCEVLVNNNWPRGRRIVQFTVALLTIGVVTVHVFAFAVYPRFKDRVLSKLLEREARNPSMPSAPELRRFQVDNLANEITFRNPEPLLAYLGALALLGLGSATPRQRAFAGGIFVLNLLPLLIFANRATPYSPIEYWDRLLAGGPEQQTLIKLLGPDLRLKEGASSRLDYVFPGTTCALYDVHSVHGYASLFLSAPGQMTAPRSANVVYKSDPGAQRGEITVANTNQLRFLWASKQERAVMIVKETANSIHLRVAAGRPDELIRTDTYYPGWRVDRPEDIVQRRNDDGFLTFSIPSGPTDLVLRYEPSYAGLTQPLAAITFVATVSIGLFSLLRSRVRKPQTDPLSGSTSG